MTKIEQTEAKVGAYLMHGGGLCRLESEPHPGRFSVELVSVYPHNMTVQCGGMVSCYSADEFTPISNPFWQAAALSFENKRLMKQHALARPSAISRRVRSRNLGTSGKSHKPNPSIQNSLEGGRKS